MDKLILIFLGILLIAGISFGISWLITKGLIFVMASLFNIHWETKFWAVFILLYIISLILGNIKK